MLKKKAKKLKLIRMLCTCGKRVKVSVKFAGKNGTCPKCGASVSIPPLKVVQKMMQDAKKASKKQEKEEDEEFDIPSLPSLKEIVLEDSSAGEDSTFGDKIKVPKGADEPQGTVELLMAPDVVKEIATITKRKTSKNDSDSVNVESSIDDFEIDSFDNESALTEVSPFETGFDQNHDNFVSPSQVEEAIEQISSWDNKAKPQGPVITHTATPISDEVIAVEAEFAEEIEDAFEINETSDQAVAAMAHKSRIVEEMAVEEDEIEEFPDEFSEEDFAAAEVAEYLPEATMVENDEFLAESIEDSEDIVEAEIIGQEPENFGFDEVIPVDNSAEGEQLSSDEFLATLEDIQDEESIQGGEILKRAWKAMQNEKYDEALLYLCSCICQGQDLGCAYYLRGILYFRKKSWDIALENMKQARQSGHHEIHVEKRVNQILYYRSQTYKNINAYEKSLADLDKIISSNTQIEKGKVHWARSCYLQKNLSTEAVLSNLEDAIFHHYLKAEVFEARGKAYFEAGDYESSMHDFTAALNHGGKHYNLYRMRAEAYYRMADVDKALKDIKKAIEMKPNDPILYDIQGILYTEKGVFEKAESSFEHSFGLDPQNPIHFFNRGVSYTRQKKYDQAISDFTKVLEMNPNDRVAYLKRAICYQEKPNPDLVKAREDFKNAEYLEKNSLYRVY